jgi:hypothetical protein
MNTDTVTRAKIRSWIERHRTRPNPSPVYLEWLRGQYRIRCEATVIKGKPNENGTDSL